MRPLSPLILVLAATAVVVSFSRARAADPQMLDGGYAIVVSQATFDDAEWKPVVEALREKYQGATDVTVIAYDKDVADALPSLREAFPRYTCFVAKKEDAGRQFIADVHQLTRQLDDDVYTDTIWGVLTGYDAADALRIAECDQPLTIKKAAAGTKIALECSTEGVWYCELKKNRMVTKQPGGEPTEGEGPDDTTHALAETLSDYQTDLFVTSGHATERNWMIGYSYRNGYFISKNGQMMGRDTSQDVFPINSTNPKVLLAVGNCLMGHVDGPDAMAVAWMHSVGVHQMAGYTVPSWYGYMGWGLLDYMVEQPGRFTAAEAFFVNNQALTHRVATYFDNADKPLSDGITYMQARSFGLEPNGAGVELGLRSRDAGGLLHDRDVVAFYGDPAWRAIMGPGPRRWEQVLAMSEPEDGPIEFAFSIAPNCGEKTFEPVDTNGSQRGGRPIVMLLPFRVEDIEIVEGEELSPMITDDFILVPNPGTCDGDETLMVRFTAKRIDG